jgi:hypothetical protein
MSADQLAWIVPVTDRLGRQTSARVAVNASHLIVITTPDGSSFGVDTAEQFDQLSAALRQARNLALVEQERTRRRTTPRKRHRR